MDFNDPDNGNNNSDNDNNNNNNDYNENNENNEFNDYNNLDDNNDNNEENESNYAFLPPEHPYLKRYQISLEEQLKADELKLRLLYKEKNNDAKILKKEREEIGISLYNLQQKFALIENSFNDEYTKCKILEEQQKIETDKLTEEIKSYNNKFQNVKEQEKLVLQSNEDLNQINSMIQYVEKYNLQVESDIKVTKNATHKTENLIINKERQKKEQDFFIDVLEMRMKNLTEKKMLFQAQIESQEKETKEAKANLAEADEEIKKIIERKKQLVKDLNNAILNLELKDKAKVTVIKNIEEQEDEKIGINTQINRYKSLIRNENMKNNELEDNLRELKKKIFSFEQSINQIQEKYDKLSEKRVILQNSINKAKNEIDSLVKIQQKLDSDLDLINKDKVKILNEAKKLQEQNLIDITNQENELKQGNNLSNQNQKINKEMFDLLVEKDAKSNEIIRIQIDKLNIESENIKLKNKLESMSQEMQKLEDDYNKKDQKIKNCQKQLEKKQSEMEQLNKIYGELIQNRKDDNEGEFEVAINKLQKKIKELRKDIRNKEVEWLTKNQELIRKENILNNLTEEVVDKRSKRMILDRKKMQLNEKYSIHEKEVKEIEISLKQLRDNEMGKFSKLLEKNINTNENLEHQIFDINIKFKEKLTNLENESVKLEMEIEVLREEKSEILAQIIEAERQITLWERKIELQEQLQKIIKPETGRKEIDEMRNYINKQKIVYKKLISEQENVIKNMEKSVQRRDYIKVKYPVNENKGTEIKNKGNKNKELNNLMEQINKINKKKKEYSNKIASTKSAVEEINDNFNQLNIETFTFKDNAFNLRNEYFRGKINTNNLLCKSKQYQESSKMIEDFTNNKFKPKKKDALREELKVYQNENKALISSLNNFKTQHNELSFIIDQVLNLK